MSRARIRCSLRRDVSGRRKEKKSGQLASLFRDQSFGSEKEGRQKRRCELTHLRFHRHDARFLASQPLLSHPSPPFLHSSFVLEQHGSSHSFEEEDTDGEGEDEREQTGNGSRSYRKSFGVGLGSEG